MPERVYYCICGDGCEFETLTREQIVAAIAEATGNTPTSVDDAFITKLKEINANTAVRLWLGTEAQYNALDPLPSASHVIARLSNDGKVYLCSDDSYLSDALGHKADAVHTHVVEDITDIGTAAEKNAPTEGNAAAGEVVLGNDTRLTDSRAPTAHSHIIDDITDIGTAAALNAGEASGVATLTADSKVAADQASSKIISATASKTLALSDAGTMQLVNSPSAITITIPANTSVAFPVGTEIEICRYGSGTVTISRATGATINGGTTSFSIKNRYSCAAIKKVDTDAWIIAGDVE